MPGKHDYQQDPNLDDFVRTHNRGAGKKALLHYLRSIYPNATIEVTEENIIINPAGSEEPITKPTPDWVRFYLRYDVRAEWAFHARSAYENEESQVDAYIRYDASDNLIVIMPRRSPLVPMPRKNRCRAYFDIHRRRAETITAFGTNEERYCSDVDIEETLARTRPGNELSDPDEIDYALRQLASIGIFIRPIEPDTAQAIGDLT